MPDIGGSFSLLFDGDETEDIAFNAVASTSDEDQTLTLGFGVGESMQSKLESLGGSIGSVTVSRSAVGTLEYSWTITFSSKLNDGPPCAPGGRRVLFGRVTVVHSRRPPRRRLCVCWWQVPAGPAFGQSHDLPFDASEAEVKAAITAFANVGDVDVHREGPDSTGGYRWTVRFKADPGDMPEL